jgi:hypothetical protein
MSKISGKDGKIWYGSSVNITNAVHADGTVTVTAAGHGLTAGERITIQSVTGMTDLNDTFTVDAIDGNDFDVTLSTEQSYSSGGTVQRVVQITNWTANQNAGVKDVSDSGSSGKSEFISDEFSDWDITFEGWVIGGVTPPGKGESIAFVLDKDGTYYFSGNAIITQQTTNLQVKGGDAIKAAYTAQGTGTLTEA